MPQSRRSQISTCSPCISLSYSKGGAEYANLPSTHWASPGFKKRSRPRCAGIPLAIVDAKVPFHSTAGPGSGGGVSHAGGSPHVPLAPPDPLPDPLPLPLESPPPPPDPLPEPEPDPEPEPVPDTDPPLDPLTVPLPPHAAERLVVIKARRAREDVARLLKVIMPALSQKPVGLGKRRGLAPKSAMRLLI